LYTDQDILWWRKVPGWCWPAYFLFSSEPKDLECGNGQCCSFVWMIFILYPFKCCASDLAHIQSQSRASQICVLYLAYKHPWAMDNYGGYHSYYIYILYILYIMYIIYIIYYIYIINIIYIIYLIYLILSYIMLYYIILYHIILHHILYNIIYMSILLHVYTLTIWYTGMCTLLNTYITCKAAVQRVFQTGPLERRPGSRPTPNRVLQDWLQILLVSWYL
jgi:hypothetical protein